MPESNHILTLQGISCGYEDHSFGIFSSVKTHKVLHDINLCINKNEFFGLVGESGCGKSTLAKAILGLIPFSGTMFFDGQEIKMNHINNRKTFARHIQAVFQDPLSSLDMRRTIGQTMQEPLDIHGIGTKKERYEMAVSMLETVGLDASYMKRFPFELSGGQRQRVCIGASLILNPQFLIADEAISSLDVSVGSQILNLFMELHEKMEFSMLFISHNLDVVHYLCDRVAVMHDGVIIETGTSDEIYYNPSHSYTKQFISSAKL
ncbi:MAG: ATP-binding cassette domain-containing protein [Treponema sp.]|nr:ATP-binding cassette domain-containing protein [Treponema sp.]